MSQKHQKSPGYAKGHLVFAICASQYALPTHVVMDSTVCTLTESTALVLSVRREDCRVGLTVENRISIIPKPLIGSHDARRPGRLSQEKIATEHLLKVLKPLNTQFDDVLNFQSDLLMHQDQRYDDYCAKVHCKNSRAHAGADAPYYILFSRTDLHP